MALNINIELDDADLAHFRKLMRGAKETAKNLSDADIIKAAEGLLEKTRGSKVPSFIRERLGRLEQMKNLALDEGFGLPVTMRRRVITALAYFADPDDMIADSHPALGFLDDAIMIELVARELEPELSAYDAFCAFREKEAARRGVPVDMTTREHWQQSKRLELINRIQKRQSRSRASRTSSFSLFRR